jgi:protocatechuate 3,4-dioxygenase beta subunit
MEIDAHFTRRRFLFGLVALIAFARWGRATVPAYAQSGTKPPTPECPDEDDVTPRQTAGPFYTPDSPLRTSLLESSTKGTPIAVTGYVLTTDCKPVASALLDFWHADDDGVYDNVGYKLRGHQFTDEHGRYRLETIVPGKYPGRTRHIHVRVQAPDQRVLTTQLYFPREPSNDRDGIFDPALLMDVKDAGDAKEAAFNFVLKMA